VRPRGKPGPTQLRRATEAPPILHPRPGLVIYLRMHRVRLFTLGLVLAAFIGTVLAEVWSFTLGIVIAVIVFVSFAVAALVKGGPGWKKDEEDTRNSWDRRMR
jgi:hypothetical protein